MSRASRGYPDTLTNPRTQQATAGVERELASGWFMAVDYVGRNPVYGNGATPLATFGQPLGGINNVDPGRQVQLEIGLRF